MYKKLLLPLFLLFNLQTISAYVITTTYHYTYTTPLSRSLVMGDLHNFLEESKHYSEEDIYFALQEFIRLRPLNGKEITSPSIKYVLKYLHKNLTQEIKRIENQIKHQYRFDYESLITSAILFSLGATLNKFAYHSLKSKLDTDFLIALLLGTLGTTSLCASAIDIPNIFNPNRDNAYLQKYKNMLRFVKKLKTYDYPYDNRLILQHIIVLAILASCCTTAYLAATAH
jgi:hypothetical protein